MRPWIFDETTDCRRATRYPEAVRIGVPAIGPLPLCTLGVTVCTSTAPKAARARTKYSPPAATMASSSKTTSQRHLPRRGASRSIRNDASSSFRSRINGVQLSLAALLASHCCPKFGRARLTAYRAPDVFRVRYFHNLHNPTDRDDCSPVV